MQDDGIETLYCVVDLHAITVWQDPASCARATREVAAAFLAIGLDPARSILFNQSQVPGARPARLDPQLRRPPRLAEPHDPVQGQGRQGPRGASVGLYAYPTLMAADILLYHGTHVPVGEDQKQHVELTRDIAAKFNHDFGVDFFPLPEPVIEGAATRVMSLRDGTKKMSKSDPSDMSRINLTDDADAIAQKIRKARTDPEPLPETLAGLADRPEARNLVNIYAALAGHDPGGGGRGVRRPALLRASSRRSPTSPSPTSPPITGRMTELMADPAEIDRILGARRRPRRRDRRADPRPHLRHRRPHPQPLTRRRGSGRGVRRPDQPEDLPRRLGDVGARPEDRADPGRPSGSRSPAAGSPRRRPPGSRPPPAPAAPRSASAPASCAPPPGSRCRRRARRCRSRPAPPPPASGTAAPTSTSKPMSAKAVAITFAPRSCPSWPILTTSIRGRRPSSSAKRLHVRAGSPRSPRRPRRPRRRPRPASSPRPGAARTPVSIASEISPTRRPRPRRLHRRREQVAALARRPLQRRQRRRAGRRVARSPGSAPAAPPAPRAPSTLSTSRMSIGVLRRQPVLVDPDDHLLAAVDRRLPPRRRSPRSGASASRSPPPWSCRRARRPPRSAPTPCPPAPPSGSRRSSDPASGSTTWVIPVSCCRISWVLRAIRAENSVGSAIASSNELVCRLCVPPSTAAIAS